MVLYARDGMESKYPSIVFLSIIIKITNSRLNVLIHFLFCSKHRLWVLDGF